MAWWQGLHAGKTLQFFPRKFDRYVEPFLGSGAVALHLAHVPSVLADTNHNLIQFYLSVKDTPVQLTACLKQFAAEYNNADSQKEYYINARKSYNEGVYLGPQKAAAFLFLNKTCFNGIWRVNSSGAFNVPFGQRIPCPALVISEENFNQISEYLNTKNVEVINNDFRLILEDVVSAGDLVYCDPPYVDTKFTSYTAGKFTENDHEDLIDLLHKADRNGCKVVVSSSSTTERFQGFKQHITERSTSVSGYKSARGKSPEYVYTLGF